MRLLEEISFAYDIPKPDIVDVALNMTDEDYCKSIEDQVFDKIQSDLQYHLIDYIDEDSAHIGSEGLEDVDIYDCSLESFERIERDSDEIIYSFRFTIQAQGVSYDYWGRDEDTKEIITSDGTDHIFAGWIEVSVEREANIFINYEEDDSFLNVEITDGLLTEISYNERFDNNEYEYSGNICPDCGKVLTNENDAGTGFCIDCERKKL